MPEHPAPLRPLSRLPSFDPDGGDPLVVIETPRNSRNKYSFDESLNAFRIKAVLPEGTVFPYDFGFIPSTRAEDGDPLDVLVLLDEPAAVGSVAVVRLLGVIEAEQREPDGAVVRNDRLIAAASLARAYRHVESIDDLRPGMLDEVEAFFDHYTSLSNKRFTPLRRGGPDTARELIERARLQD
jgi:inorganic pyrophosphatase